MNNWFASWFDTTYYHTLYKHRDDTEAQLFLDQLTNYLNLPLKSNVLDVACGKGRHAAYLAQKGYTVSGIDLSANSIQTASNIKEKNLFFAVHDMRQVYKPNAFDLVLNCFTSFGYFDNTSDDQKTFHALYNNTSSKGFVVLDFINVHKAINNLVPQEQKVIDGTKFNITRFTENGFIKKKIEVVDADQTFYFEEQVRMYTLEDFNALSAPLPLSLVGTFGDYKLSPFNKSDSNRLILVFQKN